MPNYYENYKPARIKQIDYFKLSWEIFPAFGAGFFSFTNHFSIVPIMKTLTNEPLHTVSSSILRSQYFPVFLYLTVAYAGYISFGEETPDFVLFRTPFEGDRDIFMTFVQFGCIFCLVLGITLRNMGITNNFAQMFQKRGEEEDTRL